MPRRILDESDRDSAAEPPAQRQRPDMGMDISSNAATIDASEIETFLNAPRAVREDTEEALWTVEQLGAFLKGERLEDGSVLESRLLAGSLEAEVERQAAAYAEGLLGFSLRRENIRFPMTAAKALALREAITSGEINGCVVEAYPTEEEISEMAGQLPKPVPLRMLDLTAANFLAMHFMARRGKISRICLPA